MKQTEAVIKTKSHIYEKQDTSHSLPSTVQKEIAESSEIRTIDDKNSL